eukprot:4523449-Pleurochrysis_carterae.AAC.1
MAASRRRSRSSRSSRSSSSATIIIIITNSTLSRRFAHICMSLAASAAGQRHCRQWSRVARSS